MELPESVCRSPPGIHALRIEKAFGPDMDHLLRMLAYDVARTRQHAGDIDIKRYVPA